MKATVVAVFVVSASLGLHVSQRNSAKMSDLVLANIERWLQGKVADKLLKCYKNGLFRWWRDDDPCDLLRHMFRCFG